MVCIYVLELQHGCYYVGKSNSTSARIEAHASGCGAAWTQKHPPISVLEVHDHCVDEDEDKYVKIMMRKHGIDKVRGGAYSQVYLSKETMHHLRREIWGNSNACFHCGDPTHYIRDCPRRRTVPSAPDAEEEDAWLMSLIDIGQALVNYFRPGSATDGFRVTQVQTHGTRRCASAGTGSASSAPRKTTD